MTAARAATLLTKHQCGTCRRDPLIVPYRDCMGRQPERTAAAILSDCSACLCLLCDRNHSMPRDPVALRRARRANLLASGEPSARSVRSVRSVRSTS